MKDFLSAIKSLTWKQILATSVLVATLIAVTFFFSSCNIARSGISGDRVVDKNVKDSVHYELVVEK